MVSGSRIFIIILLLATPSCGVTKYETTNHRNHVRMKSINYKQSHMQPRKHYHDQRAMFNQYKIRGWQKYD